MASPAFVGRGDGAPAVGFPAGASPLIDSRCTLVHAAGLGRFRYVALSVHGGVLLRYISNM